VSPVEALISGLAGLLIGLAKAGVAGLGIAVVPLMAEVFGAKPSVGIVLPILITGDIFALVVYRRFAAWKVILRLFPFALAGILGGVFFLDMIDSSLLKRLMGGVVLGLIGLKVFVAPRLTNPPKTATTVAPLIGIVAGITTAMANAAGPLMTVYFLWMGLEKKTFIGTAAWFFFVVNLTKVPFLVGIDLITLQSLRFSLVAVPFVVLGGFGGVWLLKRISQRIFEYAVTLLAIAGAVKLLI
jgi:uncharacterized membrane protein YfcA